MLCASAHLQRSTRRVVLVMDKSENGVFCGKSTNLALLYSGLVFHFRSWLLKAAFVLREDGFSNLHSSLSVNGWGFGRKLWGPRFLFMFRHLSEYDFWNFLITNSGSSGKKKTCKCQSHSKLAQIAPIFSSVNCKRIDIFPKVLHNASKS